MLLNFIKVDFREDLLLKKYFELINSGVKPSEILVLMQNSTLKKQFSNKETYLAIHKVVHKLNEPYKEVFLLRTFCELSFSQIGVLFEKSENWARVTYDRAKVMIKEELE